MRATQKKRMSCPVSITCVGKNLARSAASSLGHPRVENGQRPEENQVSSTSSSWYSTTCSPCAALAFAVASASLRATTYVGEEPFPVPLRAASNAAWLS